MRPLTLAALSFVLAACATVPPAPRGRDVSRAGGVHVQRTLVPGTPAVAGADPPPAPFDLAALQAGSDDDQE